LDISEGLAPPMQNKRLESTALLGYGVHLDRLATY
jgi:hypothetical protein